MKAFVIGLMSVGLSSLGHAQAQVPAEVLEFDLCSHCEWQVERVATLGSADGPGTLGGELSSVQRDHQGRFIATQFILGDEVLVFDPEGAFRTRLGRRGQGPGEFQSAAAVVWARDSLYVLDNSNQRLSVFRPDLSLQRTAPLSTTFVYKAMAPRAGGLVVNATVATADGIGFPLHVVDPDGRVTLSFGSETAALRPGLQASSSRALAPARDGGIWAAHRTQYVIEKWGVDGKLLRRLVRQADWFQPYLDRPIGGDEPPPPYLLAVREVAEGQLMVLINVAAPDYLERRGPPVRLSSRGNPIYDVSRKQDLKDTIVEIIDTNAGTVLFTRRLAPYLQGFADDEHIYGYRVDDGGVPFTDILRVLFTETVRR